MQLASDPFFLLDESLSSSIVGEVSRVTGYSITTVSDEWPGRDRSFNRIPDEEIIPYLGYRAGPRAVWITGDRKAFAEHGQQIHSLRVSVLWLRGPGRRSLEPEEQLRMLCVVMERVYTLIVRSDSPVYLRVRLDHNDGYRPFLERLNGTVLDRPIEWVRVPLTQTPVDRTTR